MTLSNRCRWVILFSILFFATESAFGQGERQGFLGRFRTKKVAGERQTLYDLPYLIPGMGDREAVLAAMDSLLDPEANMPLNKKSDLINSSSANIDPDTPQISVEVRFITCSADFISPRGFDLQNGWGLVPNRHEQKNGSERITDQIAENASNTAGVVSITETFVPVAFRFLDKTQLESFTQTGMKDPRINVLQAPKITMCDGQRGYVSDTTENYFVTSVREIQGDHDSALQPGIEIVHEGQLLEIQPKLLENGSINLKRCNIVIRKVENVDDCVLVRNETPSQGTTLPSATEMNVTGATIQSPIVKTTCISLPITIPGEKVLLVAFPRKNALGWEQEDDLSCIMIHCTPLFAEEMAKTVETGQSNEIARKPSKEISDEWEKFWLSGSLHKKSV